MNWLERFDKQLAVTSGLFACASAGLSFFSQIKGAPIVAVVCNVGFFYLLLRVQRGSAIRDPNLMQLRAGNPNHLLGRAEDVQVVEDLCVRVGTVVLVGQSGAGKTSLVKAGLMPKQRSSKRFLPLYLDRWDDVDWEVGLSKELGRALAQSKNALSDADQLRLAGLSKDLERDPFTSIDVLHSTFGVHFVLVFDQFERYLVRHFDRLLEKDCNTFISSDALVASNAFWNDVSVRVTRSVTVLFCVPQDVAFALGPFRFGTTAQHWLKKIDAADVRVFLTSLATTDGSPIERPNDGWTELIDPLLDDLTEKEGGVLGAQLRIALQGIAATMANRVSEQAYIRAGGLHGIEARLIKQAAADTASRFAVGPLAILSLLHSLVDRSKTSPCTRALTVSELIEATASPANKSRSFSGVSETDIGEILGHLDRSWNLVRATIDHQGRARWSLAHDYLARAVDRTTAGADRELQRRYREYRRAGRNILRRWESLLPPIKLLLTLRDRLFGKVSFDGKRWFVVLSALRLMPYCLALLLMADHGVGSPIDSPVQGALDFAGITIFRPIKDPLTISSSRSKLMRRLERALLAREPEASADWTLESWAVGQAAYALTCAGENAMAKAKAEKMLKSLFDSKLLIRERDARGFGWQRSLRNTAIFAPPALWVGSAVARLAALKSGERTWLDTQEQILANFVRGPAATFYPRQQKIERDQETEVYSTYATVLALTNLLELHSLEGNRSEQIQKMVDWLSSHHRDDEVPGWPCYPTREDRTHVPFEGLSLQTYAVMLRAHTDAGATIPPQLVAAAARRLATLQSIGYREERPATDENTGVYTDPADGVSVLEEEVLVSYSWLPWAIDLAQRWLALVEKDPDFSTVSTVDRCRVERVLGNLLGDPDLVDNGVAHMEIWELSELYMAVSGCPKLLSEPVSAGH